MLEPVFMHVTPTHTALAPGDQVLITAAIRNGGTVVRHVRIAVYGIPETWYRLDRATVALSPFALQEVRLIVEPPPDLRDIVGVHPIAVVATAADDPGLRTSKVVMLDVAATGGLSMGLAPATARGRSVAFRLTLVNNTDADVLLSMLATDLENRLSFRLLPGGPINLQPGDRRVVTAKVSPVRHETMGEVHLHEIEFRAVPEDISPLTKPDPQLVRYAYFIYQPPLTAHTLPLWARRLPAWWWLLAALLPLFGVFFAGTRFSAASPRQLRTAVPGHKHVAARSRQVPLAMADLASRTRMRAVVLPLGTPAELPVRSIHRGHPSGRLVPGDSKGVPAPILHRFVDLAPQVTQFQVHVGPGGTLFLSWDTAHARRVTLNGRQVAPRGQTGLRLTTRTNLILRAGGASGAEVQRTLRLEPVIELLKDDSVRAQVHLPVIRHFGVRNDAPTRLLVTWDVVGASNVLLNGVRVKAVAGKPVDGALASSYVLRATNRFGSIDAGLVLPEAAPAPPMTIRLELHPPTIKQFTVLPSRNGRPAELVWLTEHATRVLLNGQPLPPSGTLQLPTFAPGTQFTLVAINPEGSVQGMVTVDAQAPSSPGLQTFQLASPRIAELGVRTARGRQMLGWRVLGATTVVLHIGMAVHAVASSGTMALPAGVTSVQVVADNDVGSVQRALRVPPAMALQIPAPRSAASASPTPKSSPTSRPRALRAPSTATPISSATPLPTAPPRRVHRASPSPTPGRVPRPTSTYSFPTPGKRATHAPSSTPTQPPRATAIAAATLRRPGRLPWTRVPTSTHTPVPTVTATRMPARPTVAPTWTRTKPQVVAATLTPTETATVTPRSTATATPTVAFTPTGTATPSATPTATPVPTAADTATPTGTATPTPAAVIAVEPALYHFADTCNQRCSVPISITNTGSGLLKIGGIALSASSTMVEDGTCDDAAIAAGQKCTFNAIFTPGADPGDQSGSYATSVSITSNGRNGEQTLQLSAGPRSISVPSRVTFNAGARVQGFTVTNDGPGQLPNLGVASSNPDFAVEASSSTCNQPIPGGSTCAIFLLLSPTGPPDGNNNYTTMLKISGAFQGHEADVQVMAPAT